MAASASSTTPISPRSPRRATEAGPGLDVRGRRWRRRGPQSVMPNSFQHPPIGTGEARSGKPPLQTENGLDSRTDRHSDVGRSENRHLQVVRAESRSALGGVDKFGSRPLLGFSTQLLPVGMRRQSGHSSRGRQPPKTALQTLMEKLTFRHASRRHQAIPQTCTYRSRRGRLRCKTARAQDAISVDASSLRDRADISSTRNAEAVGLSSVGDARHRTPGTDYLVGGAVFSERPWRVSTLLRVLSHRQRRASQRSERHSQRGSSRVYLGGPPEGQVLCPSIEP
ncbi:hypothetical protein BHE75_03954 [Sphingomonas haloaromaticamans]|uniref:Uncharacterized protein n=1 Tax=Edaphosphingomonas haloaromaticamans TaxID=653954 RepID=A0A1S1HI17_9SPHN|nr:hypothetical protein BHE75_03954 [Sphingomonas haloaromaticamans]